MRAWTRRNRRWEFEDAVVFSGGGNAGAAQVGMLQALFEAGVRPDLFVGCSVGALNAAYLAVDPIVARVIGLEAIWQRRRAHDGVRRHPHGTLARNFIRRQRPPVRARRPAGADRRGD